MRTFAGPQIGAAVRATPCPSWMKVEVYERIASRAAGSWQRLRPAARAAGLLAGGWSILAGPGTAHAQIIDQYFPTNVPGYENVLSRPRPEYAPTGVRVGSFDLFPELDEAIGYDNNILGRSSGAISSPLLNTRAALSANSDWSRNSVGANLSVDDTRYFDQPNQSYTNWTASLGGTLDIGRDQLTGSYSHLSLHQLGSDIDNGGITTPVPYTVDNVRVGYRTQFGRISLVPSFTFSAFNFSNTSNSNVDEKLNNRDSYVGELVTEYELADKRNLLLVVRSGTNQYATPTPQGPNDVGFSVLAGIDYTANAVFRYRALAGYSYRSYSSSIVSSRSAPVFEASAIWTPTGLTTVTGTASRRIEDALSAGVIAFTYNEARLTVDHELRRNVLLEALGSIQYAEYSNGGGNQTIGIVGGSAQWLLNRKVQLSLSDYLTIGNNGSSGTVTTTTTGSGQTVVTSFGSGSYTRNIVLLTLRLRL